MVVVTWSRKMHNINLGSPTYTPVNSYIGAHTYTHIHTHMREQYIHMKEKKQEE